MKLRRLPNRVARFAGVSLFAFVVVSGILLGARVPSVSVAEGQNNSVALGQGADPRDDLSPWGVASGAEWFSDYAKFNPLLKNAGVQWLRGFYEWQSIQPKQGEWNWVLTDRLVENAKFNNIHLAYAFAYFATWASAEGGTRRFPVKDMQFWRDYVSGMVSRYHKDIRYWEVWNEFNGSFAENGTPEIYGSMVREAYIAAKKIDPTAKIGMSVANFDVSFLSAAIKAGAADHFDYICVHPYEKLSSLEDKGEVDFLNMAVTLRKMLAANSQPVDMPLWITEIGAQAPVTPDPRADARQAVLLTKAYLLSISSGFQRVFWFEARGPSYANNMDHGLIRADFTLRPSYQALKTLSGLLGPNPTSAGWVTLGNGGYGFLFNGRGRHVLAVWAPAKQEIQVKFDAEVQVSDLMGTQSSIGANQSMILTDTPQLIVSVPVSLIDQAIANKQKPYPWGGDYSQVQVVTGRLQVDNFDNGIRQINMDTTVPVIVGDQSWRRTDFSKPGSEGHYIYFAVAPQFVPFGTRNLEITAVVRRLAREKVAGMSLNYESEKGYVDAGYFNIPESDQWQELTWKVTDANFVGGWGWNFRLNAISSPNEFLIREVRVKKKSASN